MAPLQMKPTNRELVRRVRCSGLLDLCRGMLNNSKDRENLRAPEDEIVRKLCERIGYGAVMDSAARQWRRKDPVGSFVTGPCIGTIIYELKRSSDKKAPLHPSACSASGVCIVCGSGAVIMTSHGGLQREFVHCNDCGTKVTLLMHNRKQPNDKAETRRQT